MSSLILRLVCSNPTSSTLLAIGSRTVNMAYYDAEISSVEALVHEICDGGIDALFLVGAPSLSRTRRCGAAQISLIFRIQWLSSCAHASGCLLLRCDFCGPYPIRQWHFAEIFWAKDVTLQIHNPSSLPSALMKPSQNTLPLQRLVITASGNVSIGVGSILRPHVFESTFFCGPHTPQLRHLDLEMVRMPWNSGFYTNLSTLRIAKFPLGVHSMLDKGILYVLRDSPNLLSLDLSLNSDSDPPSSSVQNQLEHSDRFILAYQAQAQSIELKLLHTLKLEMPVCYVHRILSIIVADSLSTLALKLGEVSQRDADLVVTLTQPGVLPSTIMSSLGRLMVYTSHGMAKTCLSGWRHQDQTHLQSLETSFVLEWRICFDPFIDYFRRMAIGVKDHHMPLLQELELVSDGYLDVGNSDHPFVCFKQVAPSLTWLRLSGYTTGHAVPGFISPSKLPPGGWPCLTSLAITSASLDLETSSAFPKWCLKSRLPVLHVLDLSRSLFTVSSKDDAEGFVRSVEGLGVAVIWFNVYFLCQHSCDIFKVRDIWPEDLDDKFV